MQFYMLHKTFAKNIPVIICVIVNYTIIVPKAAVKHGVEKFS
jgi:hypothetical protein